MSPLAGDATARVIGAASAGALYAASHVGFGLWPLVFVCLALWWRASLGVSAIRSAAHGLVFGFVAYAVAMGWLLPTAARFAGAGEGAWAVGFALWLLLGAWIAAGFAAAAVLTAVLRERGIPLLLAGPTPLVLVEWLQPRVFNAGVGESLGQALPLAQLAALTGPLGLTAFVAIVNALLLEGASRRGRAAGLRSTGLAIGTIALVAAGGALRLASFERPDSGTFPESLVVGLVQTNRDPREDRRDAAPAHEAYLAASRRLLEAGPVDLLIWPENAYPRAIPRPLPVDAQPIRAELRAPLLFGANSVISRDGRRSARNSALLVGPDGRIDQVYDKQRLIPFAESDPWAGFGALRERILPDARTFSAGRSTAPLSLGEHRFAVPICFEVTLPGLVRRLVAEGGATMIVTLADDGWFGESREPEMHLALARLRAIEHGRWLIRAGGVGPSAVVSPTGLVVARIDPFEAGALRARVYSRTEATIYTHLGDWPTPGLLVAFTGLGLARRSRRT